MTLIRRVRVHCHLFRMRPGLPGIVLLMGSEDRIVPYEITAPKPHTFVRLPACRFDWIRPGTPAWNRFALELGRAQWIWLPRKPITLSI